ncbi:elongation factor G [Sutterella faecalis]|uniref:Elongation factor G n=2 Tax=Sutterella TaxID=40544 RepID=A0AAI9SC88_9BURK|nr:MULTISPECIES: elongation factor G [Sutterella]KAB7650492.1 elongation factor G [Sutterella seckii]QDA54760.1 elongation factor G [Sutterella faecalis]
MSNYSTENLRTLALVGHGSCGKTSLIEAMLYRSGMIPELGSVERGNTMCDNDALEKEVGHSIRLAVAHVDTAMADLTPVRIHILDTPGYPDYLGQDLSALDAVKSVCAVIDPTRGPELLTRRMMEAAKERGLCRMIVINKFDLPDADLEKCLEELRETWGPGVLPINLPTRNRTHVIDCFDREDGDSDIMTVEDVHRAFIERVVEEDDEMLERYLEEGHVDPRLLHPLVTKALREGHVIPVCFTSAKNLIGIRDFMKVIIRHLPHPGEANEALFQKKDGSPFRTYPDKNLPVIAQVFKIVNDPFIGKIGVFRVHQGTIRRDSVLYVDDSKKPIKATRPLILQGKNTQETDLLSPGDIGALAKIDELQYGSVIHGDPMDGGVRMRPINFPRPMYGLAIRPARRGDESRMNEVLAKMQSEDPTMSVEHDPVLNETVIRGLTDMHVRSILNRMRANFKLEVETAAPSIPYRETISAPAEGHARHKKQTGGAGQFGEVYLRIEPLERGKGFEFVDQVKGGVIPYNLIPAVEKGVREVLATGFVAGYPIEDVRVTVYDGKSHPVDSKEVAFVAAGRKAFLDALAKAAPQVLEPIVSVEVTAPEAYMGDIAGDLASRRGQVTNTEALPGGDIEVTALVPLAELENYATRLHALTQGTGAWSMELSSYQPVPAARQAELAAHFKRADED